MRVLQNIAIFIIILCMVGCGSIGNAKQVISGDDSTIVQPTEVSIGSDNADNPADDSEGTESSTDPMEIFLSEIASNIESFNENFTLRITGLDREELNKIDLLEHFPELTTTQWKGTFYSNDPNHADYAEIEISIEISMNHKLIMAYQKGKTEFLNAQEKQVLDAALNVIHREIKPGMSDYEKELAIHDYIVRVCRYDSENFDRNTVPDTSQTPYGVLVLGVAVCGGYSSTFKLFMDMLGIECDIISGHADGQPHAWNRVKIEGKYYLVDVTWDDPVPKDRSTKSENRINYEYFNVTDADLRASHRPDEIQTKIADSTKYNYFYYNNLVVSSKNEFISLLTDRINKGEKDIYILYKNVNLRQLIESQEIFEYLGGHSRIQYSFSEKANTFYEYTVSRVRATRKVSAPSAEF